MFSELLKLVELLRSGAQEYIASDKEKVREEEALELLRTYFFLKDCADEGELLLREAGRDPVATLEGMQPEESVLTIHRWDQILRNQGRRLYALQKLIQGQDCLVVINPALSARISEVIGNKMDSVVTLHGIASGLCLRLVFPIEESAQEKARLVSVMAGAAEDGIIDIDVLLTEILHLKESVEKYREVVLQMVSTNECRALSKRARKESQYQHPA